MNVSHTGPPLSSGAAYTWNVTTWSSAATTATAATASAASCVSPASAPSRFVTAIFGGWHPNASWIWAAATGNDKTAQSTPSNTHFAFFRQVVDLGSCVDSRGGKSGPGADDVAEVVVGHALLFASATVDPPMLHGPTGSTSDGIAAIPGVVQGLMGVEQTTPGFAACTVKPRLGSLAHATLRLPTLRGLIDVTASACETRVNLPCDTFATICVAAPPEAAATGNGAAGAGTVLLDARAVAVVRDGLHLCAAEPIGCGVAGADRVLAVTV